MQEAVSGCYRLELYPDETGADAEKKRAEWHIPEYVALESEPLTDWPSLLQTYDQVFVARTLDQAGAARATPFNYWRPVEADVLYVGHPGALAGLSMTLRIVGENLEGEILAFTDVRPQAGGTGKASAPIRARRVECPGTGDA